MRNGKRKQRPDIKIGAPYGKIKVIDIDRSRKYRVYNCECMICHNKMGLTGSKVYAYAESGCSDCRRKSRQQSIINQLSADYVGKKYGQLKITGFLYEPSYVNSERIMARCLCDCGKETTILWARIKSGRSKTCGHDRDKILNDGQNINRSGKMDGTNVYSFNQKLSKNNTSGAKGVSYVSKMNKYRAYITFRRKQYSLGCYDTVNDALTARKIAEEEIFGNFIDDKLSDTECRDEIINMLKKIKGELENGTDK